VTARNRMSCTFVATIAVLLAATAEANVAPAEPPAALQVVEAVWKAQSLQFAYRGYATTYSCGALRRKLRQILEGLGARDTLTIRMHSCDDVTGSGRVQIDLESPVEATAQNIRDLTTYDSKAVLAARVRAEPLASAQDIPRFPAAWKTVSLARDRKLSPADCELVDQLRRSVLPALSIRVEHNRLKCSLAFGSIARPQLRVTALIAVTDN
jgi:hypothetical protein